MMTPGRLERLSLSCRITSELEIPSLNSHSTNETVIFALFGVSPAGGPSIGSLDPSPIFVTTELTAALYGSMIVSTCSSISRMILFVFSISVPGAVSTKMLMYFGSLSGKNSTLGPTIPTRMNEAKSSTTVIPKNTTGRQVVSENRSVLR